MKRAAAVFLLLLGSLSLLFAQAEAPSADKDSPEAIAQRLKARLDELAEKTSPRVLVIPIREAIAASTAVYVEREIARVPAESFDLVLVEIHTPGGWSDAMTRICDALRVSLKKNGVPVIAFVNHEAFSAGAIIAISCDRIYIATNGKIGAASGYIIGPDGMPAELPESIEEKFSSAFRANVRALAKSKGYPPALVMAMVDRTLDVNEVEIDGKKRYVTEDEADNLKREMGLDKLGATEALSRYTVLRTICPKGRLLTLDYKEASEVGLAADILDSQKDVFAALKLKDPVTVTAEHNWSEHVFGFLTTPVVRSLLLILGLLGLYMEFKVPGFGLPGIFGIVCISLFLFSQYFMGITDSYLGLALFLIGAVLLLLEIFVIPGFGAAGISGILCIVAGLFLSMQAFVIPDFQNPWDMRIFMTNVLVMGGSLAGVAVIMVIIARYLPETPLLRRLILASEGPEGKLEGSATTEDAGLAAVGDHGTVASKLRPAGRARIGEKLVDVVADGQYIDEGAIVEVIKVKGNRIVVRKVD